MYSGRLTICGRAGLTLFLSDNASIKYRSLTRCLLSTFIHPADSRGRLFGILWRPTLSSRAIVLHFGDGCSL